MHHLQSWDEKLCSGAWGPRVGSWAEGFRRSEDLDHWASFYDSFITMVDLIQRVASGERHPAFHHPVPPATSTTATSPKLLSPTVRRAASTRPSAPRSATPSRASNLTSRATPGRNQPPSARLLASLAGVPRER